MTSLSNFLVTGAIGLSALVGSTGLSPAADLLPPAMRPAYADWTGLYVGGFGGVGCLEAIMSRPMFPSIPTWPVASV